MVHSYLRPLHAEVAGQMVPRFSAATGINRFGASLVIDGEMVTESGFTGLVVFVAPYRYFACSLVIHRTIMARLLSGNTAPLALVPLCTPVNRKVAVLRTSSRDPTIENVILLHEWDADHHLILVTLESVWSATGQLHCAAIKNSKCAGDLHWWRHCAFANLAKRVLATAITRVAQSGTKPNHNLLIALCNADAITVRATSLFCTGALLVSLVGLPLACGMIGVTMGRLA